MLEEPTMHKLQEQIEESRQKIDRLEDTLRSLIVKFGEMILERDEIAKESKTSIVINTVTTNIGGHTNGN